MDRKYYRAPISSELAADLSKSFARGSFAQDTASPESENGQHTNNLSLRNIFSTVIQFQNVSMEPNCLNSPLQN